MLDVLHSERFIDKAPYEVYATLLDEGVYHCSIRTMYRILEGNKEVRERRNQLAHPPQKSGVRPSFIRFFVLLICFEIALIGY